MVVNGIQSGYGHLKPGFSECGTRAHLDDRGRGSRNLEELGEKGVQTGRQSEACSGDELTEEEKKVVHELKKIDREVRAHEQAHKSAAGPYARGGASYQYKTGPDGKQYAVAGEVKIDTSEVPNDPKATIRKMQQVRRAALAPKDPSMQDRLAAAEASRKAAKAQIELGRENNEKMVRSEKDSPASTGIPPYEKNLQPDPGGELIHLIG